MDQLLKEAYASSGVPITKDYIENDSRGYLRNIGEYTYGAPNIFWWGENVGITIGKYCSISSDVSILLGGNHRTDWVTTFPFSSLDPFAAGMSGHPATNGDVYIGNDVWLGSSSSIMSGVTVGDGACVGHKAVVTKDVPPYAIVAGNPARVVRLRFTAEQIERLLKIKWWDWPHANIRRLFDYMLSQNIDEFLNAAEDLLRR